MEMLKMLSNDIKPSDTNSKSARFAYLDLIKILSAFLIVLYHFSFYSLDYGFVEGENFIPNANRIIMSVCACGVPLFFMVSGALMLSKKHSIQNLCYKVLKIALLVFIFRYLKFPSWFFITLAGLYILLPIFDYCYKKRRTFYYLIMAVVFLFPFVFNEFAVISKLLGNNSFSVTGAKTAYSILYFLLGNVLFRKKELNTYCSGIIAVSGLGLLLFDCVVLTNANGSMEDGVNSAFPTIGALLLSVGIFELFKGIKYFEKIKIPSFFTAGILPIYLFHLIIKECYYYLFGKPNDMFFALIGSVIICFVCCLIGFVIRKTPILCLISKI